MNGKRYVRIRSTLRSLLYMRYLGRAQ